MNQKIPHIVLIEPYYGGSHRAFLIGLQKNLPFEFTLISLPARKWKMRMQLAAPWMADEIARRIREGAQFNAILCSTFVDVATLRILLMQKEIILPVALYFHENQFAYPNQVNGPGTYQFTALNFTSALAADATAFNSSYNLESFLEGVEGYLHKATDIDISSKVEEIKNKSCVLYPGIDFDNLHVLSQYNSVDTPVIVWNHRWEHDKDPEAFFQTLFEIAKEGSEFKLIVLGQRFERTPEIFEVAKRELAKHIIHFGYVQDRKEYFRLLHQGDIVVSTAIHEFFGMAVLEAVRCGCRPLVPDRLSYRELFPEKYRYAEGGLADALTLLINEMPRYERREALDLTEKYSWQNVAESYTNWLEKIL